MTKITPVDHELSTGTYKTNGTVHRVFDSNAYGELIPVEYSILDNKTFTLKYLPANQVYAEVTINF